MYLILLGVLLQCAILHAAETVIVPENLDDVSECCVQFAKALAREPHFPIHLINEHECNMCLLLHIQAHARLKNQSWPIPRGTAKMVRGIRSFFLTWPNHKGSRKKRCGLPLLKKSFDATIEEIRSGWKETQSQSEGWRLFVKKNGIIAEENVFIISMIRFFSLSDSMQCHRRMGVADEGKPLSERLLLSIKESDFDEVQTRIQFYFNESGLEMKSPA